MKNNYNLPRHCAALATDPAVDVIALFAVGDFKMNGLTA